MTPRRFLTLLRRSAWLIALATLLAGGSGYFVSRASPPIYRATAKLLVSADVSPQSSDAFSASLSAEQAARTYADFLKTRPVLGEAARRLNLDETQLAALVDVRLVPNTPLLQILVDYSDPHVAQDAANALADALIQQRNNLVLSRLDASRRALRSQLDELATEIDQRARAVEALRSQVQADPARQSELNSAQEELIETRQLRVTLLKSYQDQGQLQVGSLRGLELVEPAVAPSAPVGPNVPLNTAMAAAMGLVVGLVAVFLQGLLDDSISSPERLHEISGLQVLTVVPVLADRRDQAPALAWQQVLRGLAWQQVLPPEGQAPADHVVRLHDGDSATEAFRRLRTNVQLAAPDRSLRTLLVTSAGPGEGRTTTAANLAVALAGAGFSTLLVDADFRRPSLHELFRVPMGAGLAALLRHDGVDAHDYLQPTAVPNLQVLPAGPTSFGTSELLASPRASAWMVKVAGLADCVVVDGPPVLTASDALVLASQADGVLLVVAADTARTSTVRGATEALTKVGAFVVGGVLNRQTGRMSSDVRLQEPVTPAMPGEFLPLHAPDVQARRD